MKKMIITFLFLGMCAISMKAQEITMFSGFSGYKYYQDDKEIDKKELQALFDENEEVKAYWKKAKHQNIGAVIGLTAELGFAFWMTAELLNDDPYLSSRDKAKNALNPAIGVIGTGIIGGIFMYAANNSKKKAILTYNKQFDKTTTFRLVPTSNRYGVGLALKF